jgi:hypothetical protein
MKPEDWGFSRFGPVSRGACTFGVNGSPPRTQKKNKTFHRRERRERRGTQQNKFKIGSAIPPYLSTRKSPSPAISANSRAQPVSAFPAVTCALCVPCGERFRLDLRLFSRAAQHSSGIAWGANCHGGSLLASCLTRRRHTASRVMPMRIRARHSPAQ